MTAAPPPLPSRTLVLDDTSSGVFNTKQSIRLYGELIVLQNMIPRTSKAVFKIEQKKLETQILVLLPQPLGTPVMVEAGKTLASLFKYGNSDRLFPTVNTVNDLIKMRDDASTRIAAFACLGEMYRVLGGQTGPLSGDTITILGKFMKPADFTAKIGNQMGGQTAQPFPLRNEANRLLSIIVTHCDRAADEFQKNIFRMVRPGLSDRSPDVRGSSALCLVSLIRKIGMLPGDLEATFHLVVKALENSDAATRDKLGLLMAHLCILMKNSRANIPSGSSSERSTHHNGTAKEDAVLLPLGAVFSRAASTEAKIGVYHAYKHIIALVGEQWVENNSGLVIAHFLNLLSVSRLPTRLADAVAARAVVTEMIYGAIHTTLDEAGQVKTVKELCKAVIQCVQLPNLNAAQHAIVAALRCVSRLLLQLDSAALPCFEAVRTAAFSAVASRALSVRLSVAWCLRCLVVALPRIHATLMLECVDKLYVKESLDATHGYGFCLAAMASTIPCTGLGVPMGLSTSILTTAEELLKPTAKGEAGAVEIEVGWMCLSALTTQKSSFWHDREEKLMGMFDDVFKELPELVGRSVKSKKASSASTTGISEKCKAHLKCVAHAIGALYNFCCNCDDLVVASEMERRIVSYLIDCVQLVGTLSREQSIGSSGGSAGVGGGSGIGVGGGSLPDIVRLLKIRLYKTLLLFKPHMYATALPSLVRVLVQDVIHVQANEFTTLLPELVGPGGAVVGNYHENLDGPLGSLLMFSGVVGTLENEPACIIVMPSSRTNLQRKSPTPMPLATSLINHSVLMFGHAFPLCTTKHRRQLFDYLATGLSKCRRSFVEKLHMNALAAMLSAMQSLDTSGQIGDLDIICVKEAMSTVALGALRLDNPTSRLAGAEIVGLVTKGLGGSELVTRIDALIDLLQTDRDAVARTGNLAALGSMVRCGGRLVPRKSVQRVIGILNALSVDTSPTVQLFALHAFWQVSESPSFFHFVMPILDQLLRMFFSSHHSTPDVQHGLGRLLNALLSSLGPELQVNDSTRRTCELLCIHLRSSNEEIVSLAAAQCTQTMIVFAGVRVQPAMVLPFILDSMMGTLSLLRHSAASCLLQMVQRNAMTVVGVGLAGRKIGIEDALLSIYNSETDLVVLNIVRKCVVEIVANCGDTNPTYWLKYSMKALSSQLQRPRKLDNENPMQVVQRKNLGHGVRGNSFKAKISSTGDVSDDKVGNKVETECGSDEERDGEDRVDNGDTQSQKKDETEVTEEGLVQHSDRAADLCSADKPRSHTRFLAMICIAELMQTCEKSADRRYHFDLMLAREYQQKHLQRQLLNGNEGTGGSGRGSPSSLSRVSMNAAKTQKREFLVDGLGSLIRAAFNAATSDSVRLSIAGFECLSKIITLFQEAVDPDVENSLLLSQYQAQVAAALRPAFLETVNPDITSAAGVVCGAWLSSGATEDEGDLKRIQQLVLGPLLETGNAKEAVKYRMFNEAASIMVRVSLLHAWAEVQLACNGPAKKKYLGCILDPYLPMLGDLWLGLLRDYAILNLPESYVRHLGSGEPLSQRWTRDAVRETYDSAWITTMASAALLMPTDYGAVFLKKSESSVNEEYLPSDELYLVFSLAIHALSVTTSPRMTTCALDTLMNIFTPRIDWRASAAGVSQDLLADPQRPMDLIVEILRVLRSVLLTHSRAESLKVLSVVARLLSLRDILKDESQIDPLISRSYVALEVCVSALSTINPAIIQSLDDECLLVDQPSIPNLETSGNTNLTKHEIETQTNEILKVVMSILTALPAQCSAIVGLKLLPIVLVLALRVLCTSSVSVVSTVMGNIRTLLMTSKPSDENEREVEEWTAIVNTALCSIISHAQRLVASGSTANVNHTPHHYSTIKFLVLASTIFLTQLGGRSPYTTQIVQLYKAIMELDNVEVRMAVVQATRSLIQSLPKDVAAVFVVGVVPPTAVIAFNAGNQNNQSMDADTIKLVTGIVGLLDVVVMITEEKNHVKLLCVQIPVLVRMMGDGHPMHEVALKTVISICASHPIPFKSVVEALPQNMRTQLEESVRDYTTKAQKQEEKREAMRLKKEQGPKAPTIKLRMDFGNFS